MQCQTYGVLVTHSANLALRIFSDFPRCTNMIKLSGVGGLTVRLGVVKVVFKVRVKLNLAHLCSLFFQIKITSLIIHPQIK